ncbi:hypothetical protein QBC38DRAFT_371891 [Podospora fimiseda]|uniref:Uncharacterized protein n=1 Tax=Podospora fimiseda TaxID=252190 RepID=A0AAN7GPW8_9PEZI|nr:hypothetical protein QBC38DRAFT_371891 [Podospora fimiseda]
MPSIRDPPNKLEGFPLPFPYQGEGIRSLVMPGVLCPTCAEKGQEVWVIPGRACGYCRTPAPDEDSVDSVDAE